MTTLIRVRQAAAADAPTVATILSDAFRADPIAMWVWPDPDFYVQVSKDFFALLAGIGVEAGVVHMDESESSAAIWLPAGGSSDGDDEELGAEIARISGPYAERVALLDELQKSCHPVAPHAYLPFIGTMARSQGRGLGSLLLAERIDELDRTGQAAYLEASTLASARLYARMGFEFLGPSMDIPDGPSLYPMWREAR